MKYGAEMGSVAMTHITVFIRTLSGIQKLTRGDTQAHSVGYVPRCARCL
jgi:hypothetical protein